MFPIKLTAWSIRRSGANLTVTGQDSTGRRRKITGVPQIYPADIQRPHPFGMGRDEDRAPVRVELAA